MDIVASNKRLVVVRMCIAVCVIVFSVLLLTTQKADAAINVATINKTSNQKCKQAEKYPSKGHALYKDFRKICNKKFSKLPQASKKIQDLCDAKYQSVLQQAGKYDAYTKVGGLGPPAANNSCVSILGNSKISQQADLARVAAPPDKGSATAAVVNKETCKGAGFFSLPTWYKYLNRSVSSQTGKCEVKFSLMTPGANRKFNGQDILLIGLSIIDMLLRIIALIAVAFIVFGGIKYTTSQGSPDATKGAQSTIINALVGLVVAIIAAAAVGFIGNRLQ